MLAVARCKKSATNETPAIGGALCRFGWNNHFPLLGFGPTGEEARNVRCPELRFEAVG